MLKLNRVDGYGSDEILEYLSVCPNSLIYGTPPFIQLLSGHLDAESFWLEVRRDQEIVGMLPVLVKYGRLGPVFNSLAYYGSNGGVIQRERDDEAKELLIAHFYRLAEIAEAASATLISNPLEKDAAFYHIKTGYDFLDERIGQITHFDGKTASGLMETFQDPRQRNIKKAQREGVVVSASNDVDAMDFLYRTHVENMLAIGGLAKKKSFFDSVIQDLDEGSWKIYTAKKDGVPVAALLVFYFNHTVEYFCPVVLEQFRSSQSLSLIVYTAMQDAIAADYRNWNWGGTWLSQGGVYDFKKRWGTSEYPYYYYTRVFKPEVRDASKEELLDEYFGFFVLPFTALKQVAR